MPVKRLNAFLRRLRRWLLIAFVFWLVMDLALIGAIVLYGDVDRAQSADVIVVLGAGLQGNNQPGPAMRRRTAQAAALWHEGLASQIICSGGYGYQRERSEADACAELLRAEGVPEEVIYYEDASRSTEENALYTDDLMQAQGWRTALLVSDSYHLLRATLLFNQVGIENYPSPAEDPPPGDHLRSLVREVLALHWLLLKNLLGLEATYVAVL
jgi:uncharacterized SAM-binding protein YcdF (DUF218 family)